MVKKKQRIISISRQCELLYVSRTGLYYTPRPVSPEELKLMKVIDKQYLKTPWYGSRQLVRHLKRNGYSIGRKRMRRLMKKMEIQSIAPKPFTSRRNKHHKIYPYLLRGMKITRPNQVWAADITYIPMGHGFVYLVAIMDWYSRKVLSWRVSISMESAFCIEALKEAIEKFGAPEIFNTDQGSQFTDEKWIEVLKDNKIKISMDGKGCWIDNVFIERIWRSLKYENVYIKDYNSVKHAREEIGGWIKYYNQERPHSQLTDARTPNEEYFEQLVLKVA